MPTRTGLRTVARKRPNGTIIRTDYYDRRTGAYLGTDRAAALARTGHAEAPQPRQVYTFSGLCAAYLASPEFQRLAPRTQKLNRLYVNQLRGIMGDISPASITHAVVRRLRDAYVAQPTKGNRMVATLRRLLGYGKEIGVVKENAASRPGRLPERPRSALWSDHQIERFLAVASPVLRRALALMLYTVQRPSDVLAMTAGHITWRDGRAWVLLRQQKTGALIDVPLHQEAAAILAEPLPPPVDRRAKAVATTLLVPSPTGRPWSYRNFCRAWDQVVARADHQFARTAIAAWPRDRSQTQTAKLKAELRAQFLTRLQRRDFRRTGMVKMAMASATPSQIAACSGHSIDHVMRILDTYIPRRSEVALGGIEAWERGSARGQVLELKRTDTN